MKKTLALGCAVFAAVVIIVLLSMGGVVLSAYNALNSGNQAVDAKWGDVQGAYQRRFDLIPNLVETVKGVAGFEKETLTGIAQARASVGQIKMDHAPGTEADVQKFAAAQQGLGTALSRLLMVTENYPQLRATDSFRDLQAQIEGTENRINVARRDYNGAVQAYNTRLGTISGKLVNIVAGFQPKTYFKVQAVEAEVAPKVSFTAPAK